MYGIQEYITCLQICKAAWKAHYELLPIKLATTEATRIHLYIRRGVIDGYDALLYMLKVRFFKIYIEICGACQGKRCLKQNMFKYRMNRDIFNSFYIGIFVYFY